MEVVQAAELIQDLGILELLSGDRTQSAELFPAKVFRGNTVKLET